MLLRRGLLVVAAHDGLASLHGDTQAVLPQVETGKLRALAITSVARSQLVPNVPTVAEQGFPGFEALAWYAVFAPWYTPAPVVAKLGAAIEQILGRQRQ